MKVTVEDKIRNFEILLYEDMAASHAQKLAQTRKELKKDEDKVRRDAKAQKIKIEEETVKKTFLLTESEKNRADEEYRSRLMLQKKEMEEKLFDYLRSRLNKISKEEYFSFLKREIKESIDNFKNDKITVTLSSEDEEFVKEIFASLKKEAKFNTSLKGNHPGISIEDESHTRRVSITLEDLFSSKRTVLSEMIEKELEEGKKQEE